MPSPARPRRREATDYYRDRRRRKVCNFCVDKVEAIDYKEVNRSGATCPSGPRSSHAARPGRAPATSGC